MWGFFSPFWSSAQRFLVLLIQKVNLPSRKSKTVIEYLRIIATDFKCFQSTSLIDHFHPEVPAAAAAAGWNLGTWSVLRSVVQWWVIVSWDCLTQSLAKPSCHVLQARLKQSLSLRRSFTQALTHLEGAKFIA